LTPRLPIPDEVRRFIFTSVPSVPFLEAMLLLRAGAAQAWDVASVAHRLYIPQQRAEELVAQLAQAGFVATDEDSGRWHWRPAPELRGLVDELARLYSENLVGVTELIHARQERRAHQFADAFRLRKEKE
jgi:hypothetical protein